jgi:hypothetical protein
MAKLSKTAFNKLTKKKKEQYAMRIYNEILNDIVEPILGDQSTYLEEVNTVGKIFMGNRFKGVFSSDRIPKLNAVESYCVLNLDKSYESGSHWVALARIDDKTSILYDSFGRKASKIIKSLSYSGNGRILNTQLDAEQHKKEENCGSRAISFLIVLDRFGLDIAKLI